MIVLIWITKSNPLSAIVVAIVIIDEITPPPPCQECIQPHVGCCVKNEVVVVLAVGVFAVVLVHRRCCYRLCGRCRPRHR